MNYSSLKATLRAYLENEFPQVDWSDGSSFTTTNQLDTFIRQGERLVYQAVHFPGERKTNSTALVAGTSTFTLPADHINPIAFAIVLTNGRYVYLLPKDVSFIREAYPNPSTTGQPKHYAIQNDTTILLGPTPGSNYATRFMYAGYPTSIVDAGTTWLGDNFDNVLLAGAMVQAAIFMKSPEDLMATYNDQFSKALAAAKTLGDGKLNTDMYRSGQPRVDVL